MPRLLWIVASVALAIALVGLATIGRPAAGAGTASVQVVSVDPYTNASSQHETEVEPGMFAFGGTVVSAFQAGRFFSGGASSNIGWATSTNAGASWTNGFLPGLTVYGTPAGTASRATDPAVGYDRKTGAWLIVTLVCAPAPGTCSTSQNSIMISRSSDGISWSLPVTVHNGDDDKEWVTCDNTPASPFYGHCYVSWNDVSGGRTLTSVSTDGGLTWGAGVPTIQMSGVQPLVQPSGTLIIVGNGGGGVTSVRSTNGGVSYGAPVTVATLQSHSPTGMRAPPLPSAAMDALGKVYVSWADCRFRSGCSSNDIVISASADGVTWPASPTRVPIDAIGSGVDHFIPGLGIDPATSGSTAHLGLAYYYLPVASCAVNACQLNVGYVSSDDGGGTWKSSTQMNAQAMSLAWLANSDWPGRMVGDYIATVFSAGQFLSIFALASAPSGSTFHESMWVGTVVTPTPTPTPSPTPATPCPDTDSDGWTDCAEAIIGTDANLACGINAWPADINNDTFSDITDISILAGSFGTAVPPAPARYDIAPDPPDRFVDITDIARMAALFGKSCARTSTPTLAPNSHVDANGDTIATE